MEAKKEIIHSWVENGLNCAIYSDLSITTGSEVKLLTQITPQTKSFTANGTRYFIEESRSIERWIFEQQLAIESGFGMEFDDLMTELKKVYALLNKQNLADAIVVTYNAINGITKVLERTPTILKFCALFINAADEDRATINIDTINKKVEDWKAEGLAIEGFFEFCLLKVKGLGEAYMSSIRSVSQLTDNTGEAVNLPAE